MKFFMFIISLSLNYFNVNGSPLSKYVDINITVVEFSYDGPQLSGRYEKDIYSWNIIKDVEEGYKYILNAIGMFERKSKNYDLCDSLSMARKGHATFRMKTYLALLGFRNHTCPLRKDTIFELSDPTIVKHVKKNFIVSLREKYLTPKPISMEIVYAQGIVSRWKHSAINFSSEHFSYVHVQFL